MARLIDADELIEELIKCESSIYPITSELILGVKSGYRKAIVQVEHAPTIEAEQVRHGEWIEHKSAEIDNGYLISNHECSECHEWFKNETKRCPECGAKMDGGSE